MNGGRTAYVALFEEITARPERTALIAKITVRAPLVEVVGLLFSAGRLFEARCAPSATHPGMPYLEYVRDVTIRRLGWVAPDFLTDRAI